MLNNSTIKKFQKFILNNLETLKHRSIIKKKNLIKLIISLIAF